jgi:hypothetical protein
MHRPIPGEVQTWIAENDPLHVVCLRDSLVESLGFDARSVYVETYWLGVVGPSAMWALRRLTLWLEAEPDGFDLPLAPLANELGLGHGIGRHSPIVRTLARLVAFDLARTSDAGLMVRQALPPLSERHLRRLPSHLSEAHRTTSLTTRSLGTAVSEAQR